MRTSRLSKGLAIMTAALAIGPLTGCNLKLFAPSFLGGFAGAFLANLLPTTTTVTVERNCFENGVQVDCSQIPDSGG